MTSSYRRGGTTCKLPDINTGSQNLVSSQTGGAAAENTTAGHCGTMCRVVDTWQEKAARENFDREELNRCPPLPDTAGDYCTSLPGRSWDSVDVWPLTEYRASFGEYANRRVMRSNSDILCEFQSKLNHNTYSTDQTAHHPKPLDEPWVHRELTDMFSETYMRNLPQMTLRRMQHAVAPFHAYMTFYDWGEPPLKPSSSQSNYCDRKNRC